MIDLVNEMADGEAGAGVGVALADRLAHRPGRPVSVENDLRALTAGQHWFGAPDPSFALITFGAGIGCGLVVDDRVLAGHRGSCGVVNHPRIHDDGPPCARGHRGCVSGYATTAAMVSADTSWTPTCGAGSTKVVHLRLRRSTRRCRRCRSPIGPAAPP